MLERTDALVEWKHHPMPTREWSETEHFPFESKCARPLEIAPTRWTLVGKRDGRSYPPSKRHATLAGCSNWILEAPRGCALDSCMVRLLSSWLYIYRLLESLLVVVFLLPSAIVDDECDCFVVSSQPTLITISNNDLELVTIPNNDFELVTISNNDLKLVTIPNNDLKLVTIANNDLKLVTICFCDLKLVTICFCDLKLVTICFC
jgi:hypothetical protein